MTPPPPRPRFPPFTTNSNPAPNPPRLTPARQKRSPGSAWAPTLPPPLRAPTKDPAVFGGGRPLRFLDGWAPPPLGPSPRSPPPLVCVPPPLAYRQNSPPPSPGAPGFSSPGPPLSAPPDRPPPPPPPPSPPPPPAPRPRSGPGGAPAFRPPGELGCLWFFSSSVKRAGRAR